MAGLTNDIHTYSYGGEPPGGQLVSYPVGTAQQLYSGAVALISGSGSVTTGYLKNAAVPGASDLVAGIVSEPAGGTYVQTGPGILGGSTDGAVWADVRTGTYYFLNGTGADAVTEAYVGKTVYYSGETTSGPVVSNNNHSGQLPTLGVLLPQDPGIANGFSPGANYWPVKLNVIGGP
jgi:hypothetical protein